MKEKVTYIIGHKNPDSDTIVSAIAYAYLLNQTNRPAIPCRLGDINEETKYLLERFGFDEPELMEDARVKLNEIELEEPLSVSRNTTIFKTLESMRQSNRRCFAVVNSHNKLEGIVTRSDLSVIGMGDTAVGIDLLKETPIDCIHETLGGKLVYHASNRHLNGKVSIVALASTGLDKYEIQDRIVILGNDTKGQKEAIKKGAGLLIVVWAKSVSKEVIELAKEKDCSILISSHGTMNTSRYLYFSIPIHLIMTKKVSYYRDDELVDNVLIKMRETTYQTYPVLNKKGALVGYVTRHHVMNSTNKRIVMVDHNEFSQSVKGIEKADLVGVIDHHRIHNFSVSDPIDFRNEIIGSTASIITSMFIEKNVEIPESLAGLLLGAVISDALNFQSPTTTQKDIEISQYLSKLSGLDADEFAYDMFSVTMNLPKTITQKELSTKVKSDMKAFEIKGNKILISQVFVLELESIQSLEHKISQILKKIVKQYGCDLCMIAFTSLSENGSVFYGEGPKEKLLWEAFQGKHEFQKDILSRKKQIVPTMEKAFSKYS